MIRAEVKEEAEFILREGGEIPEVAFWNAYYYLSQSEEGPRLKLSPAEIRYLKEAVVKRYLVIIERDLRVENLGQSFYRGPQRALVNCQRLKLFMEREGWDVRPYFQRIGDWAFKFLQEISSAHSCYQEALELKRFLEEEGYVRGGITVCYRA